MERMDSLGQTISATRFAAMTGVSRERLRTWERRHGFPAPRRAGRGGPRRYAVDDVQRVVSVRHAVAAGVPIPEAIDLARRALPGAVPVSQGALAAVVEDLPTPVVVLSGPLPMRIAYANGAVRALPGAPSAGAELTAAVPAFAGSVAQGAIERLFASDAGATEVHHPAWGGHARHSTRSTLFRLPATAASPPLVAMVGLEGEGERSARAALAAGRLEVDELRRTGARHAGWLEGLARLGEVLTRETNPAVALTDTLDAVLAQFDANDVALAVHARGRLVVDGSRRGLIAPGELLVAAHPVLGGVLCDAEPAWLDAADAPAWALPADRRALAVPIAVAGEALGVLVLLLGPAATLDAGDRRLLTALSAGVGFALLRGRLVAELRGAATPA
jgi:hypothetical protein